MATYTRAGSYLLAAELAKDPFGGMHRGIQTAGAAFDRHMLIRVFSDELFQAGMGTKAADIERVVPLLGGSRAFGQGYHYEGGKTALVACDFVPGRSLAQLIEKAQHDQLPFGVDHALSVIQGVAQAIVQMHAKGVPHGLLSPHSVWVSFEGAAQIIDAPYVGAMKSFLSRATAMQNWLAPYLQMASATPLQQDLFGIGGILFELLTFQKLPVGGDIKAAIDRATLKAAQEDSPVPDEIKAFLTRLLLPSNNFSSVEAFNAELERVLYDGDYSPTTFNMAFFMHTLFREENDKDSSAIKAEQADSFTAYTAAGDALRSGATRSQHIEGFEDEEKKSKNKALIVGGSVGLVALLAIGFLLTRNRGIDPETQKLMVQLQQQKALLDQQKADLDAQTNAAQQKQQQIQQQLSTTTSAQEKAALEKQLQDEQQHQKDLEAKRQKVAQAQEQTQQQAAQVQKTAKVEPPPPPPAPKEEPKPAPVQQQPQQQAPPPAPTPVAPTPVQQQPAAAPSGGVDSPVSISHRATPSLPARARNGAAWGPYHSVTVKLKVFVDETGRPLKATVSQGSPINLGFDDAAVSAAMESSYNPALHNGQASRGAMDITYDFKR